MRFEKHTMVSRTRKGMFKDTTLRKYLWRKFSYRVSQIFTNMEWSRFKIAHIKKRDIITFIVKSQMSITKDIFKWSHGHRIYSNTHRASSKRRPVISAAPLTLRSELALSSNKRHLSKCGA